MRWDGSRDPGRNHEDTKKYEGHEEDFLYKKIFVIFVIFVSSWFRRDADAPCTEPVSRVQ